MLSSSDDMTEAACSASSRLEACSSRVLRLWNFSNRLSSSVCSSNSLRHGRSSIRSVNKDISFEWRASGMDPNGFLPLDGLEICFEWGLVGKKNK